MFRFGIFNLHKICIGCVLCLLTPKHLISQKMILLEFEIDLGNANVNI
jgi:hypothetical protein